MNYMFPIIDHINDVLPHIEGFDEIIVAECEDYKVINYVVAMPKTFVMDGPGDLGGAIRRECRGLIFNADGKLISRPYHKFFNFGEKEETLPQNIVMRPHTVMEKMDGSMIRPVVLKSIDENGNDNTVVRLGTKMGVTDVAKQAEAILTDYQRTWLFECFELGLTPILEFVAPDNKIVVQYDEAKLVLTAIRNTRTGQYWLPYVCPFEVVATYGSVGNRPLAEYVDRARVLQNREGDVIRFLDGHMLKVKNSWYVERHNLLDDIRFDHKIIGLVLAEKIDDKLPMLDEADVARVNRVTDNFWNEFELKLKFLQALCDIAGHEFGMDRKRIALEMQVEKENKSFIFGVANGRNLREELLKKAAAGIGTGANFIRLLEFFAEV